MKTNYLLIEIKSLSLSDEVLLLRQTTDGFGGYFFKENGNEQFSLNEDDCEAPNYSAVGNASNLDRFKRAGIN